AGPQPDDPSHGHNLVVTDDFVFAEPVPLANSITTGRQFSGQVATFSDLDPNGVVTDYTATINWGDGHQSVGTITPDGHGGFAVSGSNTFAHAGQFEATINVQDFGGSILLLRTLIQVPPVGFAAGADEGSTSMVHVYDSSGDQIGSFLAFDPSFMGGVRVAVGDVNGDGVLDVIAASGPGQDPLVKVIDGTKLGDLQQNGEIADNALLAKFDAYNPGFMGGVNVAFGRDSLARPELVTGAGAGGGPHVLVLDATKLGQVQGNGEIAPSAVIAGFYAYDPGFAGGVTVAIGDVNGDGTLDIITGAGPGGGPHVKVVDGTKLTQ